MKLHFLAVLLLLVLSLTSNGQKISDSFNPIIKEAPRLNIVQHKDGNYLIFGDNYYYGNEEYGSLIKVDQAGKRVPNFQKVFTDKMVESVTLLPDGKLLIRGIFKYVNGVRSAQLVRLNADGSIDPTFHVDESKSIRDVVVQSTGKLIVITETAAYQEVHRLNQNGTPDPSFLDPIVGYKYRLLLGDNDNLYISNFQKIYKITPNGAVDNSFTFVSDPSKGIDKIARQEDGKLIAVVVETTFTPSYSIK